MAVDTKAKRASVQAYTLSPSLPPPDGAIDAEDRAAVGWTYAGLTFSAPAASTLDWFYGFLGWFWLR